MNTHTRIQPSSYDGPANPSYGTDAPCQPSAPSIQDEASNLPQNRTPGTGGAAIDCCASSYSPTRGSEYRSPFPPNTSEFKQTSLNGGTAKDSRTRTSPDTTRTANNNSPAGQQKTDVANSNCPQTKPSRRSSDTRAVQQKTGPGVEICHLRISCCRLTVLITASLVAVFGVAMLAGGYDAMFNAIMQVKMEVAPGSMAYNMWQNTPVPLSIQFYIFNLTNPDEFTKGKTPILQELGPYVYREYHNKTGLQFNDNATVTYFQRRWWVWDQAASGNNTEEDPISLLNTVPVSAAYSVRRKPVSTAGLNKIFKGLREKITLVAKAKDVLFYGYKDPLLTMIQTLFVGDDALFPNMADKLNLPAGLLEYDKMGWFYLRNNSDYYDGEFNMFTGEGDLQTLGMMDWWNKTRDTAYFHPPCNHISGSAGELWPPHQQASNISFYSTDLCMTLTLRYKESVKDSHGLWSYRYWADNRTFAHPSLVPENWCYCRTNNTCPLSGLLDAQTCRMGSPAFVSFPHFLHGDPQLLEGVQGITPPIEEQHQLFMDIIPELGIPINVKVRLQINMDVRPYPGHRGRGRIELMADLPTLIMPLIWFEVDAELTDDLARELKTVMFLITTPTVTIIWCIMIGLGLLAVAYTVWVLLRDNRPYGGCK